MNAGLQESRLWSKKRVDCGVRETNASLQESRLWSKGNAGRWTPKGMDFIPASKRVDCGERGTLDPKGSGLWGGRNTIGEENPIRV